MNTKANKEQANFYKEAHTTELEYGYDKLSDKIDILQSKLELANNTNKIDILNQELTLLEQQKQKLKEIEASYRSQQQYYKNYLSEKGFTFDSEGDITNGATQLDKYKSHDELESIQDAYEKYMELQRDTIPDLEKDWYDLQKSQSEAKEEIEAVRKEMEELAKIKILDNTDDLIYKYEQLGNKLDLISSQMEHAHGYEKQRLIQQQIALLEEQQNNILQTNNALKDQLAYLKQIMQSDGFRFDSEGNITNADSILALAETKDEYDELKEKVEEYRDAQSEVTSNATEWQNLKNEIIDVQEEVENLKHEIKEMKSEATLKEFENELIIIDKQLEKIQALDELNGISSLELLDQQLEKIKEQQDATFDLIEYRKRQVKELQAELINYGFKIEDDGTINDTANRLEHLKNILSEDEFDRVQGYLEDYFDIALEKIPDLENQIIDYQKEYEDVMKSKLEITESVEEEITKMIEKQVDDRIEAIEKESKARIKAINKQKDAYEKWRNDVDYEDDYNEQLEKVENLQKQIEIAKRDDSLTGKKRLEELMNELSEEQKALEDLVQERIDEQINDMLDKQIEDVEKETEDEKKALEEAFSEVNIAKIVSEALQTGVFTDVEGNIVSLEEALISFANNSSEYMGVMGETLKRELLDNLNIALKTMEEIDKINKELNNNNYNDIASVIPPMVLTTDAIGTIDIPNVEGNNVNDINIGDVVLNINGGTNMDIEDIKMALEEQRTQIIHEIMTNVK